MEKKVGASPNQVRLNSPLMFEYKNWRGETSVRKVIPLMIWHGTTEFHPDPQWFMFADDLDKGETRDFAMKDIINFI